MKVFLNLLIESTAYEDSDHIADAVLAELEQQDDFKVIWHKVSEAKERG